MSRLQVTFKDFGRSPQCQPNPAFPDGQDIDATAGATPFCSTRLPYPAPRCGLMVVKCSRCGLTVALTVAGRQDDPRSVKIACERR